MDSEVTIERATADDVDAVARLWVRLARDQRAYDSYVLAEENRATMRETLAAYRLEDGLLVARADGSIAGFASFSVERGALELDGTRATLSNLYVEPSYRDRGIGATLLEAVEESLAGRGIDVLTLEVMADNDAARRFYRRRGYETFRVAMHRDLENRSENDTHSKEGR
ncbi:GNAT family N-acetyltransferase [Natrarchaeobius oligotrophus]|uniref:GNAT family N-acetyltransferase n=1 Tax=Natrarchaeobius chitinivorans TaxID=1679083 RepID=A0A3N6N5F1_NATCH|nr:GNAT family N-acetyltransferase [Natrarchaeobius chitinivorans]RQH03067.1 GNAT family N-acetyltransferase [Natrarchaeobius chitinivorans]